MLSYSISLKIFNNSHIDFKTVTHVAPSRRGLYPLVWYTLPFKRQFHKMVKHTQTIRRQIVDELFECVDHFVGLALKGLRTFELFFNRFTRFIRLHHINYRNKYVNKKVSPMSVYGGGRYKDRWTSFVNAPCSSEGVSKDPQEKIFSNRTFVENVRSLH